MRVLYVSNYRQQSGYSRAAREYILALDRVGVDVACRPLILGGPPAEVPLRILELEENQGPADVVILHTLPQYYERTQPAKTVGLFAWEAGSFGWSCWADRLRLMDEVWVINSHMEGVCGREGVGVRVAPHTVDVGRYEQSYSPPREIENSLRRGEFLFYFVGEMVRRKNLGGLLRAYHGTFHGRENVRLVLKVNQPGGGQGEAEREVRRLAEEARRGVKLEGAPEEIIISRGLSEGELMGLHSHCHCSVTASYGEAWGWHSFDAMGFGRGVIAPASTGFNDWMTPECGWKIPAREEPCFGAADSLPELYTARDCWYSPDLLALGGAMREAYENRNLLRQKGLAGARRAYSYSYEQVGTLLMGYLHGQTLAADAGGRPCPPV